MFATRQFFLFSLFALLHIGSTKSKCKCTFGAECWPNADRWDEFNATVHGRLISLHQPFYPCHDPHYDIKACLKAHLESGSDQWLTDQPSALTNPVWLEQPDTPFEKMCTAKSSRQTPCLQGNVPIYAVDVRDIQDIQRAIKFASDYDLRLVIRNTGHDFLGRSTATGAFSVWTHHLDAIEIQDAFVPKHCVNVAPEHAVTVQAGAQWQEVYKMLGDTRAVVGGALGTIGAAGGYVGGGGHSILSPKFGMAADNALQFTVITAQGDVVVANQCQNSDLFWALRGGGGSTYGVVYDVTYRTYPQEQTAFAFLYANAEGAALDAIVRRWNELQIQLADKGFSGYFQVLRSAFTFQYFMFGSPNITFAEDALSPFVEFIHQQTKKKPLYTIYQRDSFRHVQESLTLCDPTSSVPCFPLPAPPTGTFMTSRLIPRTNFESGQVQELLNVLGNVTNVLLRDLNGTLIGMLVAGGRVAEIEADSAGLNPAWRKTLMHYVLNTGWEANASVDQRNQARKRSTALEQKLVDITPHSGAYMNEASPDEPDWKKSFFGEHYDRLLSIKHKWDPHSLFVCRECVGSDIFEDENLTCLKNTK